MARGSRRSGGATLVHGDFKHANIIAPSPSAPAPAPPMVIDWQWAGPGAAAHDLMYLMATSLSTEALAAEEDLLVRYHRRLTADLEATGAAGATAAEGYPLSQLRSDMGVHAADYVRAGTYHIPKSTSQLDLRRLCH